MSIGQPTSAAQLNQQLTAFAAGLRNNLQQISNWWKTVQFIGVAGLQQAPYSMSATDAQNFYTCANYLATIALIFEGQQTQAAAFNFDSQLGLTYGVYGGN